MEVPVLKSKLAKVISVKRTTKIRTIGRKLRIMFIDTSNYDTLKQVIGFSVQGGLGNKYSGQNVQQIFTDAKL
jgi:hypothetical protein